jgi:AraC-like DNA-binding protein
MPSILQPRRPLRLICSDNRIARRDKHLTDIKQAPSIGAARGTADPAPSWVRVEPLLALVSRLHAAGFDPEQVCVDVGLGADVLSDPERRVPYREATELFAVCVRLTGQPDFALQAGASLGLAALGLTAEHARHSPTIGEALRALARHFRLHDHGGSLILDVHKDIATLGYAVHEPGVRAVDQIADFSLAIGFRLMRELCGAGWRPSLVRFAHREPADRAPYSALFGSRLEFDSPENCLLFSASWLALPVAGADPRSLHELGREVDLMERSDGGSWTQRLRATIRAGLAIRECSIEHVSGVAGIHRRTLERRLREEGTTFKDLLDGVRHEVAIQLLEHTRLSLTDISDALDFADPAVFSRVFRRWRGMSPSAWRKQRDTARN